jgi:GTP-binding protein HflX
LPHQLVEAFRSTLDSVRLADLVVHVVDGSAADPRAQMEAVRTVLAEIGASSVPELVVVNKTDVSAEAKRLADEIEGSVCISARTGEGLDVFLRVVGDRLRVPDRVVALVIPWDRGDLLAAVHREGEVLAQEDQVDGARLHVALDEAGRARFGAYVVAAS